MKYTFFFYLYFVELFFIHKFITHSCTYHTIVLMSVKVVVLQSDWSGSSHLQIEHSLTRQLISKGKSCFSFFFFWLLNAYAVKNGLSTNDLPFCYLVTREGWDQFSQKWVWIRSVLMLLNIKKFVCKPKNCLSTVSKIFTGSSIQQQFWIF